MKATINNLWYRDYRYSAVSEDIVEYPPKPAVQALFNREEFVKKLAISEELIDLFILCNGIIVRDDLITIEFPDGLVGDYEIESDDYHSIIII